MRVRLSQDEIRKILLDYVEGVVVGGKPTTLKYVEGGGVEIEVVEQ
jgi:hypothetical protein